MDIERKRSRIIVIDDEIDMLMILQCYLQRRGFAVTIAGSGEQALREFQTQSFDAAILDIAMPFMSGIDTLREIRKLRLKIPVIMMTAYSNKDRIMEAFQLGANNYIFKPFQLDTLREVLTMQMRPLYFSSFSV